MKLCPKCQKQFSDDANFCPVDAARLVPLETAAAGTDSLSVRFDLGARLGGNQTGVVHHATDKTTGRACVVKLVASSVIALPGVAQRLERELKQLERVQSTSVAKVIASGKRTTNGQDETWVAMEMLEGAHTLASAISARGPIPIDQAADLIEVIGEALIEAAQVGVVHRDLCPKNVLFAGQDVKLINFSLPVPTTEKVPGVAEFVAPEQVDGRPVDQRSNLYSLGALYYYVLTGQTVFSGSPADVHGQLTSAAIRPPSQLAASVPAGSPLEALILRALDRSPTKRFLTVRQFVDEVGRVGRGEVIELKQMAARGANRPKGELVQTLMGVRHGDLLAQQVAQAALVVPAAVASAPTVAAGLPAVSAMAATPAAVASAPMGQQTVIGLPNPAMGMAPIVAPQAIDPQRSPWAAPPQGSQPAVIVAPQGPAMPAPIMPAPVIQAPIVPQAPIVAAPVVAAPVVAAPVVAAPVVAQQPAGKKGRDDGAQKGKFRETMWFKKGELDAQAAQAAAEERQRTGKEVSTDKADSLPMDERYKDDGSITRSDKEKYSLRTGATQMMSALPKDLAGASMNKVSEDVLIDEMKGGRKMIVIAIVIAVVAIIAIIAMVA